MLGGMENGTSSLENTLAVVQKVKQSYHLTQESTPRDPFMTNESTRPYRDFHTNIYSHVTSISTTVGKKSLEEME